MDRRDILHLFTLQRWDALKGRARDDIAHQIAERLRGQFQYAGLESYFLGDQRHEVALFTYHGIYFILVPGGHAALGYDRDNPFSPDEVQSAALARGSDGRMALAALLDRHLAPVRTATLMPFLIEARAHTLPGSEDGFAEGASRMREELIQQLERSSFRLPTHDEWEYVCAAGTRTLFRWGDDCPVGRAPQEFGEEWDYHRRPNAFGLLMPEHAGQPEVCADPLLLCGGGAVGPLQGVSASFAAWLPLASAWVAPTGDGAPGVRYRRAFSLF